MVLAFLFFAAFVALVLFLIVRLGRGRSGTSFTGPLHRQSDADYPYGRAAWFTSSKKAR